MNFIANESATKLRGGYYTQPAIARFLARWVLAGRPEQLLEPGCGDGAFLDAVAEVGQRTLRAVLGFEINEEEAAKAAKKARRLRGAKVLNTDYLEWSLEQLGAPPQFDAVLGNPPFVRYQYLDEKTQERAEALFAAYRLPFTRHTNAWVPFVIAAIGQLAGGGRLGMVVPAELLHVLHAQPLRDYLLATCSRVLVVDPQELWFDDALQGVLLLMAERRSGRSKPGSKLAVLPVRGREFLSDAPSALEAKADFVDGGKLSGKWMSVMLTRPERCALEHVLGVPESRRFADVADVDVGIVTGANKFFLVTDEISRRYQLDKWACPMFGRSEHVRGLIYDDANHRENREQGLPTNFIDLGATKFDSLPERARDYIRLGEASRLHERYKCRIRTPWYSVPSVWFAPIGMLKRSHDYPRLVLNEMRALTTDTAYRIKPRDGVYVGRLVYSFINSATMLSAELEGRHYGGGVLELVPSEIEKLVIPLPSLDVQLGRLDARFRAGDSFDEILGDQDAIVLQSIGITGAERDRLFGAWDRLRRRRQRDPAEAEAA
ncbi:MAG: N-6 DNA methylase [Myxococcales bacterium]|nr:N-6 DNA methylase [Myxococcales bacterium]